ncbi:MAG: ATP-binding protein, partial [Caulobacteraceae bacterium]
MPTQDDEIGTIDPGPIEGVDLEALRPTLSRMRRVAKALFECRDADVVLIVDDATWRTSSGDYRPLKGALGTMRVVQGGSVWVADTRLDEIFASDPRSSAPDAPCFYAGAPISLEDGFLIGALCVMDDKPRPYDVELASRLEDVAAVVGHECDRARAVRQRDLALERIERSEQRIKLAVENAGMHVFELDFVRREVFKVGVEDSFHEKPKTFEELSIGIWDCVHPDDREACKAGWREAQAKGVPHRSQHRVNRSDGLEVWCDSITEFFRDESGRPLRLVGAMQNITERKRAEAAMAEAKEAAEASNLAKSAFLATMSHEIRTPLNGVLGMAQAMAAEDLSEVQRDRLKIIRESGEILLAILNDVLDLSKIEAGKLELETIDFDLGEIARGAHAAFTALANRQGLSFAFDIESALGVYRGDPTRLRQILYNLISNALKFTPAGEIRVTAKRLEDGLSITVSDTGVGIPADRLQTLFAKFSQVDASTTRRFGGTGLGLAICRELAELMGGGVAVSSATGIGSDFTLTLPLQRVGDSELADPLSGEPAHVPANAAPSALRVLAAEDNAVNQLVLKTLLAQIGVEPVVVTNGREAVDAWEAGQWDLILMDVQMPEMDGLTATGLIRQREAELSRPRT